MKRKTPIENLEAVKALAVELAMQGKIRKFIRGAIRAKFGITPRYDEISEWVQDVDAPGTISLSCTRMNLILYPDPTDAKVFAHLASPRSTDREPWRIYRGPVIGGERPYRVMPEKGDPFAIWARSLVHFIEQMRKRGIYATCYDPEDDRCEQAELFTEERRIAA